MATIKSFSDLQQSKKLAEILPLESADMYYSWIGTAYLLHAESYNEIIAWRKEYAKTHNNPSFCTSIIPCWSLSALLSLLPFHLIVNNQRYAFSMHKGLNKDGETYMFRYNVFNTNVCLYATDYYNNSVDACVEMILKLHELNLL